MLGKGNKNGSFQESPLNLNAMQDPHSVNLSASRDINSFKLAKAQPQTKTKSRNSPDSLPKIPHNFCYLHKLSELRHKESRNPQKKLDKKNSIIHSPTKSELAAQTNDTKEFLTAPKIKYDSPKKVPERYFNLKFLKKLADEIPFSKKTLKKSEYAGEYIKINQKSMLTQLGSGFLRVLLRNLFYEGHTFESIEDNFRATFEIPEIKNSFYQIVCEEARFFNMGLQKSFLIEISKLVNEQVDNRIGFKPFLSSSKKYSKTIESFYKKQHSLVQINAEVEKLCSEFNFGTGKSTKKNHKSPEVSLVNKVSVAYFYNCNKINMFLSLLGDVFSNNQFYEDHYQSTVQMTYNLLETFEEAKDDSQTKFFEEYFGKIDKLENEKCQLTSAIEKNKQILNLGNQKISLTEVKIRAELSVVKTMSLTAGKTLEKKEHAITEAETKPKKKKKKKKTSTLENVVSSQSDLKTTDVDDCVNEEKIAKELSLLDDNFKKTDQKFAIRPEKKIKVTFCEIDLNQFRKLF